jgi:RND family efflux transporter MFP subunit
MNRKNSITMLNIFLILNLLLAGCGAAQSDVTPTPYPTPVRKTYMVERGDIVITIELFGRVTPLALAMVNFQMDGHVENIYVQMNDKVEKGQLLADLEELKILQSQSIETSNAIKRAQVALQIAQLTLEKYKAEGVSTYDIQIQEKLVELSKMDLDEVLIKYGIDPSSNTLDVLAASMEKARVYAPVDGVITSGIIQGRAVTTSTVAFIIGDASQSEILATIDPGKLDDTVKNMFEGMPVMVTPNDDPTLQWNGKVRQLPSPYGTGSADESNILIVLDQYPSTSELKSGDTVTVLVELANKSGLLWLPPAAIRTVGGRTFVIVNDANGPKRIDIEIGLQTPDKVEIISGLDEGQVVIGQ